MVARYLRLSEKDLERWRAWCRPFLIIFTIGALLDVLFVQCVYHHWI